MRPGSPSLALAFALALALPGCTREGAPPESASCAAFVEGPTPAVAVDELLNLTRGLDALRDDDRRRVIALAAESTVIRPDETFASVDARIEPSISWPNHSVFVFTGNRSDGNAYTAALTISVDARTATRVHDVQLSGTALVDDARAIVSAEKGTVTTSAGADLVSWSPTDPGCVTIVYREYEPHTCATPASGGPVVCTSGGARTIATAKVDLGARDVVSWS